MSQENPDEAFKYMCVIKSEQPIPSETDVYVTPSVHENNDTMPEVGNFHSFLVNAAAKRSKYHYASGKFENSGEETSGTNLLDLENLKTIYDGFYYGMKCAKDFGDSRLFGYLNSNRVFEWLTFPQVELLCTNIGRFLTDTVRCVRGDIIGIYAKTRSEWMLSFIGCLFKSIAVAPVYDTLGDEACTHIIGQTEMKAMVTSNPADTRKIVALLKKMKEEAKSVQLSHLIVLDVTPGELTNLRKDLGAFVSIQAFDNVATSSEDPVSWKQWIQSTFLAGIEDQTTFHEAPSTDDIFEICYTSGTTGIPKGVVYRHKQIITQSICLRADMDNVIECGKEVFLCYLPLAHAYELCVECFAIMTGNKLGYYNGDPRTLAEDMRILRPTIVTAVPRVLTRIHEGIMKKTSKEQAGLLKSILFKQAVKKQPKKLAENARMHLLNPYLVGKKQTDKRRRAHTFYDKFIFQKVQEQFGGNLKAIFVGGSATPHKTLKFLRSVLGCYVCEGSGLTETLGIAFIQHPYDLTHGSIGRPISSVQFKLRDVPELNYVNARSTLEGELCLKGPSVMVEYYKEPEKTKETIDENGWLGTGDIARINPNRTITLFDRTKNIFKLIQGEYIIPERVESVYKNSSLIDDILVFGYPTWTSIIGMLFVNLDEARKVLKNNNAQMEQLDSNEIFRRILNIEMKETVAKSDLKGFEKIKAFFIAQKPLFDYTELVTPTFKPMRHKFAQTFKDQIEMTYAEIVDKPL